MKIGKGFTLIELLVVVAIIGILAAIALPNFLEAQVRAKVSRAESDMRTIAIALETYRVDHNDYIPENYDSPLLVDVWGNFVLPNAIKLKLLTTPIAYLTTPPRDPFDPGDDPVNQVEPHTYHYASRNDPLYPGARFFDGGGSNLEKRPCHWILQSYGPDRGVDKHESSFWQFPRYDPTNGTVSIGNILRMGP